MPRSSLHVILNPKSGGGRAGRQREAIERSLHARGISAHIHLTRAPGHAVELAHDLACRGAERVAAAGGDGTIHDVANGILTAATPTALGIIPIGTGNDFAKIVPGARRLPGAYDVLANGGTVEFDVGRATWSSGSEYFVNAMGSGIDVEVVRQLRHAFTLPGPLKYLIALIRALAVYRPIELDAQLDGETLSRSIMMMAVGNGICQGGGFYLTPNAAPDDGRLELCVIEELPLLKVAAVLPRVLRGSHAAHPSVTTRSVERIRFESTGAPLYFQLDGELREPAGATWLDVQIHKRALRVIAGTPDQK